jgi:molybdopterin adenylyltransferase
MKIARITLLEPGAPDRYEAENEKFISKVFEEPTQFIRHVVTNADELKAALLRSCDVEQCPLVLTLGGNAAAPRDIAPETTLAILDKELPGFGQVMRHYSYEKLPIAILSRAVAGIRGKSLIINLPGRPKAIWACLKMLRPAIAEGLEQITGLRPELHVDPIELPIDKYLPFLKKIRPKPPLEY